MGLEFLKTWLNIRVLHPRHISQCMKTRNATSPNQSIGRRQQEVGIVLHFFRGFFLLLTGGAASILTIERGAQFFQQRLLYSSFVQRLCLFERLSSPWSILDGASFTHSLSALAAKVSAWDQIYIIGDSCLQMSGRSHLFQSDSDWCQAS